MHLLKIRTSDLKLTTQDSYFILSLLPLWFLRQTHPLTPFYALICTYLVLKIFSSYRYLVIGLASVFYFVFIEKDYQTFKYGDLLHKYATDLSINDKLFSLILFFGSYWLLKKTILFINSYIKINSAVLGIIGIPIIGSILYELLSRLNLPINHFLAPVLVAKSIWLFIIYLKGNSSKKSILDKIVDHTMLLPILFFQRYEARESIDLKKYDITSIADKDKNSRIGFFLVLRGFFVIAFLEHLGHLFLRLLSEQLSFNPGLYKHFNDFFLDMNIYYHTAPIHMIWAILIFSCLDFLFSSYYGYFGIFIGVCRIFGIKMTSTTDRPWMAKTFGDFCWRFMYFYSFILMNYFYIPFLNLFSKLKISHLFRKNISLFFTIAIGGFYFHFINDFYYCYDKGYMKTFIYYFKNYMPLFFVWATVIVINSNIKFRIKSILIAFPTYVVMYTLISSFRLLFKFNSIGDFLGMYAKMFNLH